MSAQAMSGGVPLVMIDNTNVQHWEYKKYEAMAAEAGYQALPYQYRVAIQCAEGRFRLLPSNAIA